MLMLIRNKNFPKSFFVVLTLSFLYFFTFPCFTYARGLCMPRKDGLPGCEKFTGKVEGSGSVIYGGVGSDARAALGEALGVGAGASAAVIETTLQNVMVPNAGVPTGSTSTGGITVGIGGPPSTPFF